jgi:hypothetical protein
MQTYRQSVIPLSTVLLYVCVDFNCVAHTASSLSLSLVTNLREQVEALQV